MTLPDVQLVGPVGPVQIPNSNPGILVAACHVLALTLMDGDGYNGSWLGCFVDELAWGGAIEKVCLIASSDGEGGKGIAQLATTNVPVELGRVDGFACAYIKPPNMLILTCRDQHIHLLRPKHAFDSATMRSSANLEAGWICRLGWTIRKPAKRCLFRGRRIAAGWTRCKLIYHELLIEASRGEDLGFGLMWESDGTDDVEMLEGVQTFTGLGIPHFTEGEGQP